MTFCIPAVSIVEAPPLCWSSEAFGATSPSFGGGRLSVVMPQNVAVSGRISQTSAFPDRAIQSQSGHASATSNSIATVVIRPTVQVIPSHSDKAASLLAEARRLTGWKWERLATALGKTRQALNAWTLGGAITDSNFERLSKLVATLRFIDRGSSEDNRSALAMATADGGIVLDLIDAERFDEVRELLGAGVGNRSGIAESVKLFHEARKDQISRKGHWFDRLSDEAEIDGLDIVPVKGEKRRIIVRRG